MDQTAFPMKFFSILFPALACFVAVGQPLAAQTSTNPISPAMVEHAGKLIGLEFPVEKQEMMRDGLNARLSEFQALRKIPLPNDVPPAVLFNPLPVGFKFETARHRPKWNPPRNVELPKKPDDLAFYSVAQLGALIKSKKISSERLTGFYLARLKQFGPRLECVVTLTEDLAIQQARRADAELARGIYRGPLHGIPYGAKDLLATKGIRTTWGSVPFQQQMFSADATVVRRLDEAGAVLVAKLTLGELAMGDVWFGGLTRNPWNPRLGSSGSSAGSAAATSAGLVAFAIGSETHGSIVSPCTVCGVTGLRPSYGRVSRHGAMALSWSMDKLGPICRTVDDCALVFNAIRGPDGIDQTLYDAPFNYHPPVRLARLRIGYLKADFEKKKNNTNDLATLRLLESLGAKLIPIELPKFPVSALGMILSAEAGAAFDELTRSGKVDLLVRQARSAWPNAFRQARFIPAVEYLQAQRIRFLLIQEMAKLMEKIDVYVAPSDGGDNLLLTNLTGHPCIVMPNGFSSATPPTPTSITLVGKLFGEANLLGVAKACQDADPFHERHPNLSD